MPRAVLDVAVRALDERMVADTEQDPTLDEYLYQVEPTGLPMLIERDYLLGEFIEWTGQELEREGFDPVAINLRYASIDVKLAPLSRHGRDFSFPFMINSVFSYQGLTIHGPFVAGHQAGLSMVQSLSEVKYARFFLPPRFDGKFTSDHQTSIISHSIHGIVSAPGVDGMIAGLPDRGRDPESYVKSNIGRVLTGGHITDAVCGREPGTVWPGNPLRGRPYKLTPAVFAGTEVPLYADDFTYYSFLPDGLHEELLQDRDFLRLTDLIRRFGPMFKARFPDTSTGLLFNPGRNMEFITGLLKRSVA
jgi:hypothetical protein